MLINYKKKPIMEKDITLLISGEEYEDELKQITEENDGIFDPEPESNITAEVVCSLSFGLVGAIAAIGQIILQYKSLKNEKIVLVTSNGVYRNITLEQAQTILKENMSEDGAV